MPLVVDAPALEAEVLVVSLTVGHILIAVERPPPNYVVYLNTICLVHPMQSSTAICACCLRAH